MQGSKGEKGSIGYTGKISVTFIIRIEEFEFHESSYGVVCCTGQPGRPGEKGVHGLPGSPGEPGQDGRAGK